MMVLLRLLHILAGVFWGGALLFAAGFLLPAIRESGPAGGEVMRRVVARRYPQVIGLAAITTVLSGFALYWRDISMSAGAFARSHAGMTYGLGGLAALVTFIIGIAVIAPSVAALGKLGAAVQGGGGKPTPEQASTMARLSNRMATGTRVGAGLLAVAIVCMAIARYV